MNHHIVLLHSFYHLKCTPIESPTGIGINCFLWGKKDYEVPEENNNGIEVDECKAEELTELMTERSSIWQKALDESNKASQYMVKRELRLNPPSLYS